MRWFAPISVPCPGVRRVATERGAAIITKSDVGNYSYHATKKRAVIQAGTTSYGYDANGNMTSRGGSTIGYTSYNLPGVINAGSNSSTLSYGAYRNRYKQVAVAGGVSETTIYVGGILEKVTRSGTTTWRHRIEGPGGLLAIVNCSGSSCNPTATTNYVHRDHLGSPELVTNSAGTEVVKLSFGAFGERRDRDWHGPVSSSDMTAIGNSTRRGFTEHEHLDSVGLVHMNGRVYDPTLARFLSSDPIEDGLGRVGGFNRYAYVSNRPLTLVDPSGYGSKATRLPKHDAGPLGPLFEPQNWSFGSDDDYERRNYGLSEIEVIASRLSNWPAFSRFYGFGSGGAMGGNGESFRRVRGGPGESGPDPGHCDKPGPDASPTGDPKTNAKAQCLAECENGWEGGMQTAAGAAGGAAAAAVLALQSGNPAAIGPAMAVGAVVGGVTGAASGFMTQGVRASGGNGGVASGIAATFAAPVGYTATAFSLGGRATFGAAMFGATSGALGGLVPGTGGAAASAAAGAMADTHFAIGARGAGAIAGAIVAGGVYQGLKVARDIQCANECSAY